MKIAYIVSMKENLETFIRNEAYELTRLNCKITFFATLSNKQKYIQIHNKEMRVFSFGFFSLLTGFLTSLKNPLTLLIISESSGVTEVSISVYN